MKTLLVVVTVIFGPSYPDVQPTPKLQIFKMGTETACTETAKNWQKASGQIIGAPGYRRLQSAWCESEDGKWPMDETPFPKAQQ